MARAKSAKPARAAKTTAATPASWRRWSAIAAAGLGGVLLFALGAYGVHYLSRPDTLPLRVIEIRGGFERLDRADIQRTVEQSIDGGFFSCDMIALRAAVVAMPWVAEASIRRVWPDRLQIHVEEEVPLARWHDDALVNTGARVFRPRSLDGYQQMVRLRGPDGSVGRVVTFYQRLEPVLGARGLHLVELELDARRHWWLRFDDGLVVSLGRERTEHRLAAFLRVYPSLAAEAERRPQRIDMRYAHGFAVLWQPRQHPSPDTDSQGNA
jgi:cell division protein FtsQ